MMDIKSPDDVGLVSDTGSSDVGIVNRREVNDGFDIGHGFYDLAKVLNVANKVFDGAPLRTGQAVEHCDLMRSAVEQIAHDPLTHFTNAAGDENFHCACVRSSAEFGLKRAPIEVMYPGGTKLTVF